MKHERGYSRRLAGEVEKAQSPSNPIIISQPKLFGIYFYEFLIDLYDNKSKSFFFNNLKQPFYEFFYFYINYLIVNANQYYCNF